MSMNEYKLKGFLNELEDLMNRYDAEINVNPSFNSGNIIIGITINKNELSDSKKIYHQVNEIDYRTGGIINSKKIKERN